jgi:8-oxo-dGTP pyrophosphatase MutT (NUDIX family)
MIRKIAIVFMISFITFVHYKISAKRVAIALLRFEDEFLIVRNARGPFRGFYGLPGGKASAFEFTDHAVAREIKEEVGISIDKGLYTYLSTYQANHGPDQHYNINMYEYRFEEKPEIYLDPAELSAYQWIKIEDMGNYILIPDNSEHIREVYNR